MLLLSSLVSLAIQYYCCTQLYASFAGWSFEMTMVLNRRPIVSTQPRIGRGTPEHSQIRSPNLNATSVCI